MSTITSPRESSLRRFPSGTPTSSTRPSLDTLRSNVTSPVNAPSQPALGGPPGSKNRDVSNGNNKRSNRAALREYYNLRNAAAGGSVPGTPRIEIPDSEVPGSELDLAEFDAGEYVNKVVAESNLGELLRLYTRVLGEVRALDAEKKALVYDNYSKLISATETIRKMRTNMDPLNPMASTLDPAIAQIYSQASAIRETLRQSVPAPDSEEGKKREAEAAKRRTRQLAIELLAMPDRLRVLVKEDKLAEAKKQWALPRRILVSWKERGVGGTDVEDCIDDGDEILEEAEDQDSARPSQDDR